MKDLDTYTWSATQLAEAIRLLGEKSGFSPMPGEILSPPKAIEGKLELCSAWVEDCSRRMGLEAEPVGVNYGEVDTFILKGGPGLIHLPKQVEEKDFAWVALLGSRRKKVLVLGPDGLIHSLPPALLYRAICQPMEENLAPQIEGLLDKAKIAEKDRSRIRQALLAQYLAPLPISGCWLLRLGPCRNLAQILRQAKVGLPFFTFLLAHIFQYLLWIISWWIIGKGAFEGHLLLEWLIGWGLILFSLVPLKALVIWAEGHLSIRLGGIFKQRLLYGAMRIKPDDIRHLGAGGLLGRVFESEALETLTLSGGLAGMLALIEIIISFGILFLGPYAWLQLILFMIWMSIFGLILFRYWQARIDWTEFRLQLTNDLVEKMAGHRTRLVQETKKDWHLGEDEALEGYLGQAKKLDQANLLILSLMPRGWLVLGLLGLTPALVGGVASPASLAITLGGVLLIYKALAKLSTSFIQILGAAMAYQYVSPFLSAANQPEEIGSQIMVKTKEDCSDKEGAPLLVSRHLFFQYPQRRDPVIQEGDLTIYKGDRLLLEGPSGCGKSTLAAILANQRLPKGGLILLHGLDRHILGEKYWRKIVSFAPQFHENYVFTETFLFNLLMGKRWPPKSEDFQEAEAICQELGLGELLAKMPAGLLQMVGETGWQLSHGEKSRLYMARTLLQEADLIILDETLAALDPKTLEQCLQSVLQRAKTLLVITHR